MMKYFAVASVACLLGACASTSDTAQSASTTAPSEISDEKLSMSAADQNTDELICRTQTKTGSRLKRDRVCRTRNQWVDHDEKTKEDTRQLRRNDGFEPGASPSGAPGG